MEPILGAALLLVLPRRPRLVVAGLMGVGLAALVAVKLLDIGFSQFLGRGFNVVLDWGLLDDAESYLEDTLGGAGAAMAVIGVVALVLVLVLVLFAVMALAVVRLTRLMDRGRERAVRVTVAVVPGVRYDWPEGDFYGFDKVYDSRDLGYRGPEFS